MADENPVDKEIKRIDDWLTASGMTESRLGLLACANPRAVERVRNGTASVATLKALVAYVRQNPVEKK